MKIMCMNCGYRNEYASDLRSYENYFKSSSEKKGLKMIQAFTGSGVHNHEDHIHVN